MRAGYSSIDVNPGCREQQAQESESERVQIAAEAEADVIFQSQPSCGPPACCLLRVLPIPSPSQQLSTWQHQQKH